MAQKKRPTAGGVASPPLSRARLTAFGLPALAVALTFAIRLWFILEMRGHPFSTLSAQMIDPWQYHVWALEILHRSFWGSEVFFLRPLYPYLLAAIYRVFGVGVLPVQLLQALLAAASCLLLYDSTRRVFHRTAGLFAAFGFALTGILVFYTGTLLYVEVTVFFSLFALWLVLVAGDRLWCWALAGVSFGLAVICRPELLVLLPFFVWLLWRQKTAVRRLALLAGAAIVVVAAVPIRNLAVAREPVLFTAHSGINFYYGWNPWADGTWQQTELERTAGFSHAQLKRIARVVDGRELSWSQASSHWTREGLEYIARNPGRTLWLLGRKFLLFWSNYEIPNNYYPETARPFSLALKLAFVNFGLVAALGLAGMVLALRRKAEKPRNQGTRGPSVRLAPFVPLSLYPFLLVAAYLLSALAFYVLSRLRAPVMPFLLMFAGYALSEIIAAARRKKWSRLVVVLVPVAALYVGSNLVPVDRQTYTAQAWTQAGNVYMTMGSGRAFDAFRRALGAEPGNPVTRYGLFVALAGMGKMREAEAEYQELVRVASHDRRNRVLVELAGGRIAVARRDFPRAAQHYEAAATLDPLNAENHYLLGLVLVSMDSLEQARLALSRALEIDPNHDAARSALKLVESRLSESDERTIRWYNR